MFAITLCVAEKYQKEMIKNGMIKQLMKVLTNKSSTPEARTKSMSLLQYFDSKCPCRIWHVILMSLRSQISGRARVRWHSQTNYQNYSSRLRNIRRRRRCQGSRCHSTIYSWSVARICQRRLFERVVVVNDTIKQAKSARVQHRTSRENVK